MNKARSFEPLLRAEEVAQMLNIKVSTVYEWVRMDYIPHIRLGTGAKRPCVRFFAGAIQQWLREKKKDGRTTRVP